MIWNRTDTPPPSRPPRRATLALAIGVLGVLGTLGALYAQESSHPAPRHPTPAESRAEFERHCTELGRGSNAYFGRAEAERLAERLARLEAAERAGAATDRVLEARLRGALGLELLRLGEVADGTASLTRARELVEAVDDPTLPVADALFTEALGHLLLAEAENCVASHTPASCILPITPEAVHRRPQGARKAAELFLAVLEARPDDVQARWLLNVARQVSGDFPDGVPEALRLPPWPRPERPFPRWPNVAARLGVDPFDLAGGAVTDDFDGDGLLDLVTSSWDPCEPMKAFRNDGRGGFEEVTEAWGLDGQLGGLNLVQADYDGDGRLDLLVLRGAWQGADGRRRNSLLRNELGTGPDGAGRFVDVTAAAGLAWPSYPTQTAAWADFDGDGDLDLYVGNEATGANPSLSNFSTVRPGRSYPSQLFRNDGDGTFTDVARAAGVENLRYAKGVAWGDVDDDGDPDLYVSNIGANRLYLNRSDGTFADVAPAVGVTGPEVSFATWFFDHDNDGDLDLLVADYSTPFVRVSGSYFGLGTDQGGQGGQGGTPALYENLGAGDGVPRFEEVGRKLGFDRPLLPMGAGFGDLDNDGWLDLYLGTGVPNVAALMPNAMYRNTLGDRGADGGGGGPGRGFEDVTFAGGFGHLQKGHAVAFADLDNDGDQDLYEQMGGAYPYDAYTNVLYLNPTSEAAEPPGWITLRLEGSGMNRHGLGARITVTVGEGTGARRVHRLVGSGGSFAGSSLQEEIGLGELGRGETATVEIRWPDGRRQSFSEVVPRRVYRAVQGAPELVALDLPVLPLARAPGSDEAPDDEPRNTEHHHHGGR